MAPAVGAPAPALVSAAEPFLPGRYGVMGAGGPLVAGPIGEAVYVPIYPYDKVVSPS